MCLLTWMVNRDREFLRRRNDQGDEARHQELPVLRRRRTPNCKAVAETVELNAAPDKVWELIGQFGGELAPLDRQYQADRNRHRSSCASSRRSTASRSSNASMRSTTPPGPIATRISAAFRPRTTPECSRSSREVPEVLSSGGRSFSPNGQGTIVVRTIVSTLFKTGLESLKSRFWRCAMIDLDSECPADDRRRNCRHQSGERASAIVEPLLSGSAAARGRRDPSIEQEQLTAQFVGDLSALDRLESLAGQLVQVEAGSARTALIQAQVASMMHRFSDARHFLAQADIGGAPSADVNRLLLNIDQACGANLGTVLDERREIATKSGRTEDLVALGALLADLREFTDADRIYRQALRGYSGRFAIPCGVGLLSARRAVGRARVRTAIWPLPSSGIGKRSTACRAT